MIKKLKSKKFIALVLIIIGLACVAISLVSLKQTDKPQPPKNVQTNAQPASDKPKQEDIASYQVAADLPKYISIKKIGVDKARIISLSSKNGEITSPNNIYDAGWFNSSSKPGQPGAMFIYGHVSSWQAKGLFHDLKSLKPGDEVSVVRGDNTSFTYKVVKTKEYPADKVKMDEVLAPISNKPGLNLMTCSGSVIKGTNNFTNRLVVFTTQI